MNRTLNLLLRIQELRLAQRERQDVASEKHLRELKADTEAEVLELPPALAGLFDRLCDRYELPVVPMVLRTCSGCLMALPEVLVQDVRRGEALQRCPNCGRILYVDDSARVLTARPRDREEASAGIGLYSSAALMLPRTRARTRDDAIGALANLMSEAGYVEAAAPVVEAALAREAVATTAVGSGLAFPHARGVGGGTLTLALGTKPKGIDFGAPDGFRTKLVFLMVVPPAAGAVYLHVLSSIARTLRMAQERNLLLSKKAPEELWEVLEQLTRPVLA
jgi:mannitol/fructose-specific phosphotransferase system IIA component (Ntr-type)